MDNNNRKITLYQSIIRSSLYKEILITKIILSLDQILKLSIYSLRCIKVLSKDGSNFYEYFLIKLIYDMFLYI